MNFFFTGGAKWKKLKKSDNFDLFVATVVLMVHNVDFVSSTHTHTFIHKTWILCEKHSHMICTRTQTRMLSLNQIQKKLVFLILSHFILAHLPQFSLSRINAISNRSSKFHLMLFFYRWSFFAYFFCTFRQHKHLKRPFDERIERIKMY